MKTETTQAKDILDELGKTPFVIFPHLAPFEIAFYRASADSQICYILSLWRTLKELEEAASQANNPNLAKLQLVSQSKFKLTWEYCILPREIGASYLCLMHAPASLKQDRFEEMRDTHRNYIKQMVGLNRVWVGQTIDAEKYLTLFRADWNTIQNQEQFLNINAAAQQKRAAYTAEGFEVEYATFHLANTATPEARIILP